MTASIRTRRYWFTSKGWLLAIFLLHLLPFLTRPALIGGDEPHYALMAHSVAMDGDFSLDNNYIEVEAGAQSAGRKHAGKVLDHHLLPSGNTGSTFAHPLGLPILASPLLLLEQRLAPNSAPDLVLMLLTSGITFLALLAGLRLVARHSTSGRRNAVIALAFYFSTPLWFYSRVFMTEPYIWAWAVLAIAAWNNDHRLLASLFLALCLAMKETAILLVAPIILGMFFLKGLRRSWTVLLGPALFGILFTVKNLLTGAPPLETFQPYQFTVSAEGLVGFLFDPARGLLWFAPLALVAALGWFRRSGSQQRRILLGLTAVSFLAYFFVAALWIDWRGGSGYGPRLLLPVLPALFIPLANLVDSLPKRPTQILLLGAFAAGFVVNWCAALRPVQAFWSASAQELVFDHPLAALLGLAVALWSAWRIRQDGLWILEPPTQPIKVPIES